MKFLNLNTGYSFDGLWQEGQEKGYIFWFPKEQSIGLTYTMPIAIVTNTANPITITIEDNNIFKLIDSNINTNDIVEIDGYKFDSLLNYTNSIKTSNISTKINGKYIHVFNVACTAKDANEYICKINIGNKGYIRVGADFYGEYEPAYINLSNMGVELPTSIQKAIYDTNVHEDITDNIIINRKFKELLSNYWNIIANRGSYKSLLNAIEWFEWTDHLKIKEIYKHNEALKTIFNDKDIVSTMNEMVESQFTNFVKTSYISLYCSLQDELPTYDNEYNPELAQVVFKWSKNDIQLKLALLAKFFGFYFLPIHLAILHATAEDKVFTNTIKNIHAGEINRNDIFSDYEYIESNIKNDSVFFLNNVRAQVTSDTVFGVKDYNKDNSFGVDIFPSKEVNENNIKIFAKQYYTGPGAIIPIELVLPNRRKNDFIKQTIIEYTDDNDVMQTLKFYDIFNVNDDELTIKINFNFLAKAAKEYLLKFTFILGSSKTLTRNIKFKVEDTDNVNINIYKICAKSNITEEDFYDTSCSKYLFRIQNEDSENPNTWYTQYLPYLQTNDAYYTGIKLSRTIIYNVKDLNQDAITNIITIFKNESASDGGYLYHIKYEYNDTDKKLTDTPTYLIFISKKFFANEPLRELLIDYEQYIIRNEFVFYPQFHELKQVKGDRIEDYTIAPYEALCCTVEIQDNNKNKEFKYGHLITQSEWTFYNHLTNETINHPSSSKSPFIAGNDNILKPGYYDIIFRYSLNNGDTNEYRLDSAFRIK